METRARLVTPGYIGPFLVLVAPSFTLPGVDNQSPTKSSSVTNIYIWFYRLQACTSSCPWPGVLFHSLQDVTELKIDTHWLKILKNQVQTQESTFIQRRNSTRQTSLPKFNTPHNTNQRKSEDGGAYAQFNHARRIASYSYQKPSRHQGSLISDMNIFTITASKIAMICWPWMRVFSTLLKPLPSHPVDLQHIHDPHEHLTAPNWHTNEAYLSPPFAPRPLIFWAPCTHPPRRPTPR